MKHRSAVILIKDSKILLMHRINNGLEYYSFVGGGVEEGETLEQGALREVKEETSLEVSIGRRLYEVSWDNGMVNHLFEATYVSGEAHLPEDSEEFQESQTGNQSYNPVWIDIEEMSDLLIFPLELRDLLIEDIEKGFSDEVKKLSLLVEHRRRVR